MNETLEQNDSSKYNFNKIWVFGDSLQDTGNLFKVLKFPGKPYNGGRFCDGLVASEYLQEMLIKRQKSRVEIENYAIGGALTSGKNPKALLTKASFSVAAQLDQFIASQNNFTSNDLIIINGGGNNFLFAIYNEYPYINIAAALKVADDLAKIVEKTIKLGARNILLWNVPDVSIAPSFELSRLPKLVTKYLKKFYQKGVKKQNDKIEKKVQNLKQKYPFVRLEIIDIFDLLDAALESPMAYGFENGNSVCVESFGGVDIQGNIQEDMEILADPNTHMFWDYVHPTSKGQKLIADKMFEALTQLDR